jgi:subtilisin-like proprotein convertase family protein
MKRSLFVAGALLATAIAGTASAAAFTYNGSGGALPDEAILSNTITVPDSFSITDVNVTLNNLAHTYFSDLEIVLGHGGTEIRLFNREGGSTDPNGSFTFDDEAATPVAAINTSGGSFRPFDPLSTFDGTNSGGSWTLRISDLAAGDTGSIGSWTLSLSSLGIPEPATWAMMIVGFGGVGGVLRNVRRRPAAA